MFIYILVVDHHALFRKDLTRFLHLLDPGYKVVAEVGTVDEALTCVATLGPDLVLTAVELPDRTGLAMVQEIRQLRTATVVIVMGDNIAAEYSEAALAVGAESYVDQLDLVRTLPPALQAAMLRIAKRGPVSRPGNGAQNVECSGGHTRVMTCRTVPE